MDNRDLENRVIKSLDYLQVYLEFYKRMTNLEKLN